MFRFISGMRLPLGAYVLSVIWLVLGVAAYVDERIRPIFTWATFVIFVTGLLFTAIGSKLLVAELRKHLRLSKRLFAELEDELRQEVRKASNAQHALDLESIRFTEERQVDELRQAELRSWIDYADRMVPPTVDDSKENLIIRSCNARERLLDDEIRIEDGSDEHDA